MLEWCDLYYNSTVSLPRPSVSLRSRRAGALVVLLGPLVPHYTVPTQPLGSDLWPRQRLGGGADCLFFSCCWPPLCHHGRGWLSSWCTGRSPVFQRGLSLGNQACWPDWVVHFALFSVEKLQEAWSRPVCHSQSVSECSQRTNELVVTGLRCSGVESRHLEMFIASWHYSDIQVAFLLYFIKIPVHNRLEI